MKVALVYSFKESDWFSCNVIVNNLKLAYSEIFNEENIVHANYRRDRFVSKQDLTKVHEEVEKVIFIDHKPTPVNFLEKLQFLDGGKISTSREYIIHVFGDFPLYLTEWRTVFSILKGCSVKLICASEKQKKYIQNYFNQKEIIFESAFPVVKEEFFFESRNRDKLRNSYGIKKDEFVFLYTGRISYQKRVVDLIHAFYNALDKKQIDDKSKLMIVGPFDNLGVLYLGLEKFYGEHFREVDAAIQSNPKYSHLIKLVGEVEHEQLNDIYNAADCYVSLSTYHDEDFGMAVAEALMTGLPAVLTNWAGYKSFQIEDQKKMCELVDVKLSRLLPEIDLESVGPMLAKIQQLKFDRKLFSNHVEKHFSVESASLKLKNILESKVEPFEKRSDLMVYLTNESFINGIRLFKSNHDLSFNEYYFEVYKAYVE